MLDLVKQKKIRLKTLITVPRNCTLLDGTSAELLPDEKLPLESLFYAMMLPSGNDAAETMAMIGGCILLGKDLKFLH
jgi:serine-type D-Ala-D-Ala carboxypeptidase (penicillin-binding protein 5/6)